MLTYVGLIEPCRFLVTNHSEDLALRFSCTG